MLHNTLRKLPTSSLSVRIVLWVFVSVIVIETIILVPSLMRREDELLSQLRDISSTSVSVVMQLADSSTTDAELLGNLSKLRMYYGIVGGVLHQLDGKRIGFFGEEPELTFEGISEHSQTQLLNRNKSRYDISLNVSWQEEKLIFIGRLDSSSVKRELYAFFWRIAGLVFIISIVVTSGAWIALKPIVVSPILRLRRDLIKAGDAISNDLDTQDFLSTSVNRRDELGDVISAFNLMYKQITDAIRLRRSAEMKLQQSYQRLEAYSDILNKELENGQRIQRNFLPDKLPQIQGLEISAFLKAAHQLSGDFYDVVELPHGCVGFVIADVCDKGVGAALFMALFRSLIRVFSGYADFEELTAQKNTQSCGRIVPISEGQSSYSLPPNALKAVELTNDYVAINHADLVMFATLFFGVLDPNTGSLSYINAGHEPLFVIKPTGGVKLKLKPTGPAIGIDHQVRFGFEQIHLDPGDILLGYTDGVPEATDSKGAFYTVEKLLSLLQKPGTSAFDLTDRIVSAIESHTAKAEQHDDITLLAIRRTQL